MSDLTRFNHSQSQWCSQPHMKELGLQRAKPIRIYCSPPSSSLPPSESMTEQPSAMCRVNVRVGLQKKKRRERKKEAGLKGVGWGGGGGGGGGGVNNNNKKKKKRLELELEEGRMAWGGDLWGTFITTQHCPREVKEEGWGERGKTFPFPFLFSGYTEATQGARSFVPLRAAAEEAGDVAFVPKCWSESGRQNKQHAAANSPPHASSKEGISLWKEQDTLDPGREERGCVF